MTRRENVPYKAANSHKGALGSMWGYVVKWGTVVRLQSQKRVWRGHERIWT